MEETCADEGESGAQASIELVAFGVEEVVL